MSEFGISNTLVSMNLQCEEGLSSNNLALSQTLQMFCTEAFKPSMLIGASAANLCGSLFGFKAFSLCSKLFGTSSFATQAITFSAKVIGEGTMFHIAPELLATRSLQTANLFRGSASSTLMIAFSQGAGKLGGGFIVQQMFQDIAVLGSQDLSAYIGWSEVQTGGVYTRLLYAQMSSCQMQVGAGVTRMTCHEITMMNAQISLTESLQTARTRTEIPQGWLHSIRAGLQAFGLRSANEMPIEGALHQANEQQARQERRKNIFMMTGGEEGGLISAAEIMAGKEDGLMSANEFGMTEVPPPKVFELDPEAEYRPPLQIPEIVPRRIVDPRQALVTLPMGGIGPFGHERSTYYKAVGDPRWMAEVGVINGHLRRIDIGRYADAATGELLSIGEISERYGKQIIEKSGVQTLDSRIMRIVRDDLYMNPLTGETGNFSAEKLKEMANGRELFVAVPYSYGVYRHPVTGAELTISTEFIREAKDSKADEKDKAKKEVLKIGDLEVILLSDLPFEYLPTGERVTRAKAEALLDAEFSTDAGFEALAKLALETDWAGQIPPGLRGPEGGTSGHILDLLGISRKTIPNFSFHASSTYLTNLDPVAALALYSVIRSARQYGFYLSEVGAEIGIHISSGVGGWQSVIDGVVSALRRKRGTKRIATVPNTETNNIAMLLNDFIQGVLGVGLGMKGEDAIPVRDNSIDVGACATGHKNFRRAANSVRSGVTRIGFFGGTEFVLGLPYDRAAITSFNAIKAMATREKLKGLDPSQAPKDWYAPLFTEAGFQIAEGAGVGAIISLHDFMRIAPAEGFFVGGYDIRGDQGGKKNSAEMGIGAIHARAASLVMMAEQLGFPPEVIQGIFLHGTGTPQLNALEVEQAAATYQQRVWLSALKGKIGGHLLGAAPSLEDAVVLQSLQLGLAPGVYIPSGGKLTSTAQRLVDQGRVLVSEGPHENPDHVESVKNGFGGNNTNVNYHRISDQLLSERFGYTNREIREMRARQTERRETADYWEREMDVTGRETGGTFLNRFGLRERPPALRTFVDLAAVTSKDRDGQKPPLLLALAARSRGEVIRYKNTTPELAEAYQFVESGIEFGNQRDPSFEVELGKKAEKLKTEEREKLASYVLGGLRLHNPESRMVAVRALEKVVPQITSKENRWDFVREIADQLVDADASLREASRDSLQNLIPALEMNQVVSLAWKATDIMRTREGFGDVQENAYQLVKKLLPLVYLHERRSLALELIEWQIARGNRAAAEADFESTKPLLIEIGEAPESLINFEVYAKKILDRTSSLADPKSPLEERLDKFLSDPEKALDTIVAEAVRISVTSPVSSENQVSELITAALKKDLLVAADEANYAQRLELARKMQGVFDPAITPSLTPYLRSSSTFQFTAYIFTKLLLPRLLPGERGSIAISLGRWLLDQHYGNHHGINYRMTRDEMIQELQEIGTYLGSAEENSRFQQEIHTMMTVAQEREIRAMNELAARSR